MVPIRAFLRNPLTSFEIRQTGTLLPKRPSHFFRINRFRSPSSASFKTQPKRSHAADRLTSRPSIIAGEVFDEEQPGACFSSRLRSDAELRPLDMSVRTSVTVQRQHRKTNQWRTRSGRRSRQRTKGGGVGVRGSAPTAQVSCSSPRRWNAPRKPRRGKRERTLRPAVRRFLEPRF